ncbi:MAG: LysR family transcriptional regulator [Cyanobacteria bacterium]|nr:LysR family transcriptional regulator [Cyanobacteriota bacterium]MDW8201449.1 LysR family transcriptional regulator [Cyanobacteriota bacterium SKYGB_h_bin112]
MRIEQLQAFLAVVETNSFQQAAQRLQVTQSTVSRQVQNLEAEIGLPLFHRTTQAKLTIAGEAFLPHARRICQGWQNALEEITALKAGKQPELCVAAIPSVCSYYLPKVLQQFCRAYPEVQLRVTALGSDRALKVLKDGMVDLAIVMYNHRLTNSNDMVVDVLYEEPIEVLMATNHPLAAYEKIPWTELARYPQVVFKDGYGMQRMIQEQFAQRGLTLKAALELNTPDAFRGVVRQGDMVALLPASVLIDCRHDASLTVRGLINHADNGIERASDSSASEHSLLMRKVVMVTTRDRLQIPPIRYFYELVQQQLSASVMPAWA